MNLHETLNAIDTEIANLQLNTEKFREQECVNQHDVLMAYSREIAYQECRNIILKVLEQHG